MRTHPDRNWAIRQALTVVGLLCCVAAYGGQKENPNLFRRDKMTAMGLKGLRIWMGTPVQVTEQLDWQVDWPHVPDLAGEPTAMFVRPLPYMAKFPGGNLIATYQLDPDTHRSPYCLSGFQISRDGGEHWGRRYNALTTHNPLIFIPKENDSLLGIPELSPLTPGDRRNFIGPAYLFEHGGDRMAMTPDAIRVLDWPWEAKVQPSPLSEDNWIGGVGSGGDSSVVKVGGRILACIENRTLPTNKYTSVVLLSSEDGGYTWRYFSTAASPDLSHAGEVGYEGPNEPGMIQLADGDLMVIFRQGNGGWHLQKAYSHDQGRTWTKPETLPACSVAPQIVRTSNETIALGTGRPGLDLWFSTDPRGDRWQKIDLAAYHNKWAQAAWPEDPSYQIGHHPVTGWLKRYVAEADIWDTTSYTAIVEMAPNKLLIMYDRHPTPHPLNAKDLARVFVLPFEIERN